MFLTFKRFAGMFRNRPATAPRSPRRRSARPGLECLEERAVPTTFGTVVSPNGWHAASVTFQNSYFSVGDISLGPSTLNFIPTGQPESDYGSPHATATNSGLWFSADSSTLSFRMTTGTNTVGQFNVTVTNPTSISVAESVPFSTFGQAVTYTATVISLPGTARPKAGTVGFYIDGTLAAYGSLNGSNTATAPLQVPAGAHDIAAKYFGSTGFYYSQISEPVLEGVSPAPSSVALNESATVSVYGQPVTLTAAVNSPAQADQVPAGSVNFYDGTRLLGSATLDGSAHAVLSVSSLAAGARAITAQYTGSADIAASPPSAAVGETVLRANTTLALRASPTSAVYGQAVSFTAVARTVAPGAGTPDGAVNFYDNGNSLGVAYLNAAGQAVLSTAGLSAGTHVIDAVYGGSANFDGSGPAGINEWVTLNLGSPALPAEVAGQNYDTALAAAGGSGHYAYTITRGALPAGLTLSPAGVVSGTATVAGTYAFTVAATDTSWSGVSATQNFSLTVSPAPIAVLTIAVPAPATAGTPFNVTLTAQDAYHNKANGTVQLTSSDGQTVSPKAVTLTAGAGSASVTLTRADVLSLTASAGSAQVVSAPLTVKPATMSTFAIGVPATATAGAPFNVTLKATDRYGNPITGYNGNATLYSNDGQRVFGNVIALTNGAGSGQATLDLAHKVTLTALDGKGDSGASGAITVSPTAPIVTVYAPATVTAGYAFGVTVKAVDQYGNGYNGSLTLVSSDGQTVALNPATVNVVNGYATFGVTLKTAGKVTLNGTAGGASARSSAVTILPAGIAQFVVTTPTTATAGVPFNVSVTAKDAYGNVTTTYSGGVYLLSGDGQPVSPTYIMLTKGVGTTPVKLTRAGTTTIKAALNNVVAAAGTLTVSAAAAASFSVVAPTTAKAGTAFDVTVTAKDAFGNVAAGFSGQATLSSSDGQVVSPAVVSLTNGVGKVSVGLERAGIIRLTASDNGLTGVSGFVTVGAS